MLRKTGSEESPANRLLTLTCIICRACKDAQVDGQLVVWVYDLVESATKSIPGVNKRHMTLLAGWPNRKSRKWGEACVKLVRPVGRDKKLAPNGFAPAIVSAEAHVHRIKVDPHGEACVPTQVRQ